MRLASRGLRDLDDGGGVSAINDAAELAAVRLQARRVQWKSVVVSIVVAAVYVVLG